MPLNTGKKSHKRLDCCFIIFNRKQNEEKRIMQELIWFEPANKTSYIGRLLPKNPKKRKKRENRSIFILTRQKQKTILIAVRRKKTKTKENL